MRICWLLAGFLQNSTEQPMWFLLFWEVQSRIYPVSLETHFKTRCKCYAVSVYADAIQKRKPSDCQSGSQWKAITYTTVWKRDKCLTAFLQRFIPTMHSLWKSAKAKFHPTQNTCCQRRKATTSTQRCIVTVIASCARGQVHSNETKPNNKDIMVIVMPAPPDAGHNSAF